MPSDAAELDAILDDVSERMERTTAQINDLAERVDALKADLGIEDADPPPSDLEAMLAAAPDVRRVRSLERRLTAYETHHAHRGFKPDSCPICSRWDRQLNGEDSAPWPRRRVTYGEDGETHD